MIADKSAQSHRGIPAWPFRVAVAAGLRWGDLLGIPPPPSTLALANDALIGFSPETKQAGGLKRHVGGSYSHNNTAWLKERYELSYIWLGVWKILLAREALRIRGLPFSRRPIVLGEFK